MGKECTKCHTDKPTTEFWKHNTTKDRLSCWCKPCHREYNKEYHRRNPNYAATQAKKWREANPDRVTAYDQARRESRLERDRIYQRARYQRLKQERQSHAL